MSSSVPYLCARCLRASRQLPRSSRLLQRAHSNTALQVESRITTRWSTSSRASIRSLATSSRLQKPSLESQTSPKRDPPPPSLTSQPQATTTPKADPKASYTTTTILNPRYDEETNEPMTINLTPRATKRLLQIMTKDSNPSLCLRVTVESGGCHGFQYLMSLVDMSKIDESEDVVFVGSTPDNAVPSRSEGGLSWREIAEGRPKVVIDESSLELLKGSNVDYTMELIGSQFKIDNPKASSSCGCGTSFDIKI